MLIQNICTVFFFEDATALVKMDNTTLLGKKYLSILSLQKHHLGKDRTYF